MSDITNDTVERWWNKTHQSNWESLRASLDEILAEQIISNETYTNLKWAVDKLETQGVEFPPTASELSSRLNFYLWRNLSHREWSAQVNTPDVDILLGNIWQY